ncbi:nicotinamide phosphoribosyltransferase-like isoform X2 [Penaeus vannamei]|uniref:nicotinamide phosphoribosyltransferase-like isoform X2 n=1 Tax=Penaeus vannamei TaxID=6689 RepID=UPI00387F78D4
MGLPSGPSSSQGDATMATGPVDNVILLADCYKTSHHKAYPPGTSSLYAYFESRGGRFPYTVFFGLQYILKRWLCGPAITKEMVLEAKEVLGTVFKRDDVFNEDGWNYIVEVGNGRRAFKSGMCVVRRVNGKEHENAQNICFRIPCFRQRHGGRIPVRIRAVPEGSVVPVRNVLFTVESTDPAVPWVTNFFETLLVQVWYPMTVATVSRIHKQVIHHYMSLTHDTLETVEFSLHDAGYRGVSSVESAALGGAAHMINFKASDTVAGSSMLRKFYHLQGVAGFSTPSSEHSTVTTWGREGEAQAHRHMLEVYEEGDAGCVCDSYDIWKCFDDVWCNDLRDLVLQRGERGGCIYLRPDSGDPVEVVLRCLEILGQSYGTQNNSKGYKMLPPYLRVIHADGIDYRSLRDVLECLKNNGWSTANAFFGAGGALLQRVNRDTQKCAYKVSHAVVNGEEKEVYKEPITGTWKKSKRGRLSLQCDEGVYRTLEHGQGDVDKDLLVPVFEIGIIHLCSSIHLFLFFIFFPSHHIY